METSAHQVSARQRAGQPLGRRRHDNRLSDHRTANLLPRRQTILSLPLFGRKGRLLNEYHLDPISRGDGQFVSASHKETSASRAAASSSCSSPASGTATAPRPRPAGTSTGSDSPAPTSTARSARSSTRTGRFSTSVITRISSISTNWRCARRRSRAAASSRFWPASSTCCWDSPHAEHMQTALEDMQVAAQLNEAKIIMQDNFNHNLSCQEVAAPSA